MLMPFEPGQVLGPDKAGARSRSRCHGLGPANLASAEQLYRSRKPARQLTYRHRLSKVTSAPAHTETSFQIERAM
jgi:hypothetical protein